MMILPHGVVLGDTPPIYATQDLVCCHDQCETEVWPEARSPLCWEHMVDIWAQVTFEKADQNPKLPSDYRQRMLGRQDPLKDRAGHVYFVRLGDMVKIGHSTNLKQRLAALPHDKVLATFPGTQRDEARCHALFADLRVETTGAREWFHLDQRILDFIAERAA